MVSCEWSQPPVPVENVFFTDCRAETEVATLEHSVWRCGHIRSRFDGNKASLSTCLRTACLIIKLRVKLLLLHDVVNIFNML
jgi:hypothetical protein